VLKQAETGKPLFWSKVFDGSDEDGLFGVGAIIGKPTATRAKTEKLPKELIGVPSWRLALAFYPNSSKELAPEHEQNMVLYRNGVAEDLILEYGDFSVRTTLTKLEPLPPPGC
jgi:envelope integrity protein B